MNYWDYIRVEELLGLQAGKPGETRSLHRNEVLFIVVHQVYELWFKLILNELEATRDIFRQVPVPDTALAEAVRGLRRVTTIFRQASAHFEVMETLTTRDYLEFRDHLIPASGFQSAQLREMEILLGLSDERRIPLGHEFNYKVALKSNDGGSSPALDRVERRQANLPSLKEVVYDWLARTPIDGAHAETDRKDAFVAAFLGSHERESKQRLERAQKLALTGLDAERLQARYDAEMTKAKAFLAAEDQPENLRVKHQRLRAAMLFLESYRELPRLSWAREVVDAVLEMEQGMVIWRQRHARMVERIIGRRTGTGGSAGVEYLDQTALTYRVFDELWAVRTLLLQKGSVPSISNEEDYRLRVEDRAEP